VPELKDHTTLRLGGPATSWLEARTEHEVVDAVRSLDAAGEPVLVLAGGSNLVVADEGFAGTVVQVATTGVSADSDDPDDLACLGAVTVTVAAGESWDALVARAVESSWVGIEALSGIPGSVGATPIQNVGAYGQEVSETLASVRTWDRRRAQLRTFAAADCGFGYRTSRFKQEPGRFVVLDVTFLFKQGTLGAPVRYAELAATLGVEPGSVGSFFTNPVVAPAEVPDGAPAWPQSGGVKTSAAWLIERAGFRKGHGSDRVSLSTKHTLALTNRGGGTTAELLDLAREIRDGVESRFGIRLVNEPVLVNCTL
jgi:UDP-N-acetylmuramate dehydrogenase